MVQVIFAFTFNTETKEAVFSGNVNCSVALKVLQDISIAEGVRQAQEKAVAEVNDGRGAKRRNHDKAG